MSAPRRQMLPACGGLSPSALSCRTTQGTHRASPPPCSGATLHVRKSDRSKRAQRQGKRQEIVDVLDCLYASGPFLLPQPPGDQIQDRSQGVQPMLEPVQNCPNSSRTCFDMLKLTSCQHQMLKCTQHKESDETRSVLRSRPNYGSRILMGAVCRMCCRVWQGGRGCIKRGRRNTPPPKKEFQFS
jgi:hypothetical protein